MYMLRLSSFLEDLSPLVNRMGPQVALISNATGSILRVVEDSTSRWPWRGGSAAHLNERGEIAGNARTPWSSSSRPASPKRVGRGCRKMEWSNDQLRVETSNKR